MVAPATRSSTSSKTSWAAAARPAATAATCSASTATAADAWSTIGDVLGRDAAEIAGDDGFDLLVIFEALHDMARPVEALAAARRALAPGGSVVIVDERVGEQFTAPGDLIERMMYGWSVSHCLPAGMDDADPSPIGTAARPSEVKRVAREAGFSRCEEQPIEHDFFRMYRLRG